MKKQKSSDYFSEEIFDKLNFSVDPLGAATYEQCEFRNCSLHEADLSGFRFIDCLFENCDLSLATLHRVVFSQVRFKSCKMLGLSFPQAEKLAMAVEFEDCQLSHSSFYALKLKMTRFIRCGLQQADFTETDLTQSEFSGSDLSDATFDKSNLEKADFREAVGFRIDPENNRVKKAKFRRSMLEGLLRKYQLQIEDDV